MEPLKILQEQIVFKEGKPLKQVLVQWLNWEEEDATWGDVEELQHQFPNFNLEDKVPVDEGGIIRTNDPGLAPVNH